MLCFVYLWNLASRFVACWNCCWWWLLSCNSLVMLLSSVCAAHRYIQHKRRLI